MFIALAIAVFWALSVLPSFAQIQYFGYVGGADDDQALRQTKGFTNFAHLSAGANLSDPFISNRVSAMAPVGVKAVIDLGKVLWCDYDGTGRYLWICSDWAQRWSQWKNFNAGILTPDKVLAFSIRDEPFNYNVDMSVFEQAAARVKSDLPWAKLFLVEAACVVATDDCGLFPGSAAVARYGGTLPNIDWIGLDAYGIWPKTNAAFQQAVNIFRSKFPGRKWIYVLDGYWDPDLHWNSFGAGDYIMQQVADDWYDVARADPNAILLGAFLWRGDPGVEGSQNLPCNVLSEHVRIRRAITGRVRAQTALPVGQLEGISSGVATGWACDPDGTVCENPWLDIYSNGSFYGTAANYTREMLIKPQCGTGIAYRFQQVLSLSTGGNPITFHARDLDTGSVTLPSGCPENPACIWH